MPGILQGPLLLVGRSLLCAIFLFSGVGKIFDFGGTQKYMEAKGMTYTAPLLVGAIAFEISGGLCILLGCWTRLGALLLLVFLALATYHFHAFWAAPPDQYRPEMINFMKNLAIAGGLLNLLATGPGRLSLDGRKS